MPSFIYITRTIIAIFLLHTFPRTPSSFRLCLPNSIWIMAVCKAIYEAPMQNGIIRLWLHRPACRQITDRRTTSSRTACTTRQSTMRRIFSGTTVITGWALSKVVPGLPSVFRRISAVSAAVVFWQWPFKACRPGKLPLPQGHAACRKSRLANKIR